MSEYMAGERSEQMSGGQKKGQAKGARLPSLFCFSERNFSMEKYLNDTQARLKQVSNIFPSRKQECLQHHLFVHCKLSGEWESLETKQRSPRDLRFPAGRSPIALQRSPTEPPLDGAAESLALPAE